MKKSSALGFFVITFFVLGCANELSTEKKNREIADREFSRLAEAEGLYFGYMEGPNDSTVPVSLAVAVHKNASGYAEKPQIIGDLRMGFVGGVKVTSTSGTFDWGTKGIVFNFGRGKDSPAALELRATLLKGELTNPLLVGANEGTHRLNLSKTGNTTFPQTQVNFAFFMLDETTGNYDYHGVLSLKPLKEPKTAPANADLPLFPGLGGSLSFDSFGVVPQVPKDILYDPIKGTLDMQMSDQSWVEMKDFYLKPEKSAEEAGPIKGYKVPFQFPGLISVGGTKFAEVLAQRLDALPAMDLLPPKTFVGTFQGTSHSLPYKAIGYLDFQGGAGANTKELPFITFPNMRLEVVVCLGKSVYQRTMMELNVLDYIARRILFRNTVNPVVNPLEIYWKPGFKTVEGTFLGTVPGNHNEKPKLRLTARPKADFKGCAEDPG